MKREIDHIVLGARTLEEGASYIERELGARPVEGGKHLGQGTHNKLVRLGHDVYLEIIAIDPDAASPGHPRWFGLDSRPIKEKLKERPRLITWVVRVAEIEKAIQGYSAWRGAISPMSRGEFRWRITLTDDGHLPAGGIIPPLIEWNSPFHPARGVPDAGLALSSLQAFHPDPANIVPDLRRLGVAELIALHQSRGAQGPFLMARIMTPRGAKTIA